MICLHPEMLSINNFAERILRLPPRLVTPLVQNPIPWSAAKNHERFVYSAMARYLGLSTDRLPIELDTREIAKDVLRFLREHGISTTDFATKVVRLQRATLTNYLVSFILLLIFLCNQELLGVVSSIQFNLVPSNVNTAPGGSTYPR